MSTEPRSLRVVANPEIRAKYEALLDTWRKELTTGTVSIRWFQSCAGYRFTSAVKAVLGTETFMHPDAAMCRRQ